MSYLKRKRKKKGQFSYGFRKNKMSRKDTFGDSNYLINFHKDYFSNDYVCFYSFEADYDETVFTHKGINTAIELFNNEEFFNGNR